MLRLLENSDAEQLQDLLYDKIGKLFSASQSDDAVTAYRDGTKHNNDKSPLTVCTTGHTSSAPASPS